MFDDLCIFLRKNIWKNIDEYMKMYEIKITSIFDENSEILEEIVKKMNLFAEREKYIIEGEYLYVILFVGTNIHKIAVYKNEFSYIGSYIAEYFHKNKCELLEDYILKKTTIIK
jgi:hypothetical protein